MKKVLLFLMLFLSVCSCNDTAKRKMSFTRGDFKGYATVYDINIDAKTYDYVGYLPIYESGDELRIYVDEDNDVYYELRKFSSPQKFPGMQYEFGYVYNGHYYVENHISY